MYLLQGISVLFFIGGGNFSLVFIQFSISFGCEVCLEVLLVFREIFVMIEFLDRIQLDLNLRRGVQG